MSVDLSDVFRGLRSEVSKMSGWEIELDLNTIQCLREKDLVDRERRITSISKWLDAYKVLRGLTQSQRQAVASAALSWSDSQDSESSLDSVEAIAFAHRQLETMCQKTFGDERSFLSLASKVLWLRYPHTAPIFDGNARNALYLLSKLDPELPELDKKWSTYRKFAAIWMFYFEKYQSSIQEIQTDECPYLVRVFDRALWTLGKPGYGYGDYFL